MSGDEVRSPNMNPSIAADDPIPPEPPFSAELLADYDAQALSPALTRHIAARLDADPRARRILDALAATRAQLADAPVEPQDLPADVEERLRHLVRKPGNISP
ncbi:hypothetical protein GCM10022231_02990 [Gordonia caeni]|uniref:Uncharacterized protein n=2 Tax=Gordonia caeni TaxID=1007097 RepID=A0ABP7NK27_9ACTN